jgi:glycosyltransferase involved in cell wall biosynthesis
LDQKTAVCFTNDLWSSALAEIRLKAPLEESGFQVIQGNEFDKLLVEDLSRADFVVIQRDFPIFIDLFFQVLKHVKRNKLPLIYEIDDNLFELPMDHPDQQKGFYSGRYIPMLWAIAKADLVTASTDSIANFLLPFNKNVHVLKNYLVDKYWHFSPVKKKKDEDGSVAIGYIGGTTHATDLKMVSGSLRVIGEQYGSKVRFKFWGALPPDEISNHPYVEWQPVVADYREYATTFQSQDIDVLIAPLRDTSFARSKSHLKFLEYSTLGVPAIYSSVTPFQQVIRHGENGFLASSQEEWINCLQSLISSTGLRAQMAQEAQKTVKQDWLLSRNAYKWSDHYHDVQSNLADGRRTLDELDYERDDRLHRILSMQSDQVERLLEKERIVAEQDQFFQSAIRSHENALTEKEQTLQSVLNSTSWKMTRPLRDLSDGLRQIKQRIFRG